MGITEWRGYSSEKAGLKCIRAFLFSLVSNATFLDSVFGFLRLLMFCDVVWPRCLTRSSWEISVAIGQVGNAS